MIYKSYIAEQSLEKINKKLFLFYGENFGLKKQFREQIKKENKNAEFIYFTQDEILKNEDIILNEIMNTSLFQKEKVFLINNSNDKLLNFLNSIETRLTDKKIYLFSELLDKKSKLRSYFEKSNSSAIIPCYADNISDIKKIILIRLKNFTGLTNEILNSLIENSNLDRVRLNNELDKIETFFTNKRLVGSDINQLLNLDENENFNELRDAVIAGNKTKTNKLLSETFVDDDKTLYYTNSINQRLNKINQILLSKKKSLDEAVSSVKPPIFWKEKTIVLEQTRKWQPGKIRKILKKTFDFELQIKTNSIINKNLAVKKLLIDICCLANSS